MWEISSCDVTRCIETKHGLRKSMGRAPGSLGMICGGSALQSASCWMLLCRLQAGVKIFLKSWRRAWQGFEYFCRGFALLWGSTSSLDSLGAMRAMPAGALPIHVLPAFILLLSPFPLFHLCLCHCFESPCLVPSPWWIFRNLVSFTACPGARNSSPRRWGCLCAGRTPSRGLHCLDLALSSELSNP